MRRILIVAFHFPPIVTTGTFRTMAWVKRLLEKGWNVTVLTTNSESDHIDLGYEAELLKNVTIYRVNSPDLVAVIKQKITGKGSGGHKEISKSRVESSAIEKERSYAGVKDFLSYFFQIPDRYVGMLFSSLPLIFKELRKQHFDIIYSTSPFTTCHLIALVLKIQLKARWTADFRDPWVDNPFKEIPGKFLNKLDAFLERCVLKAADQIVCVTPNMTNRIKERYPEIENRIHTITNGYDANDFAMAKKRRDYGPDDFVIVHPGVFYGPRSPISLFKAMRSICRENKERFTKIRLLLIGEVMYQGKPMRSICDEYGISDQVDIIPYIPKREVIPYLKGADCLLLVGFHGKHQDLQLPGKIFDYIAVGNPIFAIAPEATQISYMLRELSPKNKIADPRDIDAIKETLLDMMSDSAGNCIPDLNYEWGTLFSKLEGIFGIDQLD